MQKLFWPIRLDGLGRQVFILEIGGSNPPWVTNLKKILTMAHHKSAKKRIRSNEKKRLYNRYYKKTMRTMIKKILATTDPNEAINMLPSFYSVVDKNVKRGIIHKNKGANLKHKMTKELNKRKNLTTA